ncbi:hypothetical protein EJB05_51240, partial [Eragrostis curvula]
MVDLVKYYAVFPVLPAFMEWGRKGYFQTQVAFLQFNLMSAFLVISLHYIYFPTLAEYDKYSPLLFPHNVLSCCSEDEGAMDYFDEEYY